MVANASPRNLSRGIGPHRRTPAQRSRNIAKPVEKAGEPARNDKGASGRPAIPVPVLRDDLSHLQSVGAGEFKLKAGSSIWFEKEGNRREHVLELNGLD